MSLNISVIQNYSAYWNCYIVSQTLIRAVGRRVPCMARNCGKYNIPRSFNSRIIWDINIELCNLSRPSGTYTFQINPKILLCLSDRKKTVILNLWSVCFCPESVECMLYSVPLLGRWYNPATVKIDLFYLAIGSLRIDQSDPLLNSSITNLLHKHFFCKRVFLWSPPPCMLWERHNWSYR